MNTYLTQDDVFDVVAVVEEETKVHALCGTRWKVESKKIDYGE